MKERSQSVSVSLPGHLWIVWCREKQSEKSGPWNPRAIARTLGSSGSSQFGGGTLCPHQKECSYAGGLCSSSLPAVASTFIDVSTGYQHLQLMMFGEDNQPIFGEEWYFDGEFSATFQKMCSVGMNQVADYIQNHIRPEKRVYDLEDGNPNQPLFDRSGHVTHGKLIEATLDTLPKDQLEDFLRHVDNCQKCSEILNAELFSKGEFEDLNDLHHCPKRLAPAPH